MVTLFINMLILAAVGWGVVNLVKHVQGRSDSGRLENPNPPRPLMQGPPPERSSTMEVDGRRGDSVPQSLTQQLSPRALHEQRMQELKRRYVDDEISVDQYEAELDKLMREQNKPDV